jgi:signal transduction histidine kinase
MVTPQEFLQNVYNVGLGLTWPRAVTFKIDVSPPLPDVCIDPVRIRQVLLNLISNAHKFTSQGEVTLHAHYQAGQEEVVIGVADTGEGIAADQIERAFQRFQQVDNNPKRKRLGTGLGLAICRELVELHGGRIWVESTLGVGSDFLFTLPLNCVPPQ